MKTLKNVQTTYHAPSGQRIRQMQNKGINHIVVEKKETDFIFKSKCFGADSFTQKMWASDFETIKRWAKEWAIYPDRLTFKCITSLQNKIN